VRVCDRQKEGYREECDSQPNGKLREHMGRLRAKDVLGNGASKRGAKTLAARKLH
jgi:hypothetical protein